MSKARPKARKPVPVFLALIGDVVGSRDLEPRRRQRLQRILLEDCLEKLNDKLGKEVLAAKLGLTQGDSIQGLFRSFPEVVEVVRAVTESLFEAFDPSLHMRFGLGYGRITTGSIAESSWELNAALLDGPAFHQARGALERARDLGLWVCFSGFGPDPGRDDHLDLALEAFFAFMGSIREDWTKRQGMISIRFRELCLGAEEGISQAEMAKQAGVSPSVISETLKAARYKLLIQGEEAAVALLQSLERGR